MTKIDNRRISRRYVLGIYAAFMIWAFSATFVPDVSFASIDNRTHWEVETASQYNSIWGNLEGLEIEEGDVVSVGVFIKGQEDECYGAGLYNFDRKTYSLSAYMYEEADPNHPADKDIPGFMEGDEIVFKVHKQSTGEVFAIEPDNISGTYRYVARNRENTTKIDLVRYGNQATPTDPDDDGTADDSDPDFAAVGGVYIDPPLDESDEESDAVEETTEQIVAAAPEEEITVAEKPYTPQTTYGGGHSAAPDYRADRTGLKKKKSSQDKHKKFAKTSLDSYALAASPGVTGKEVKAGEKEDVKRKGLPPVVKIAFLLFVIIIILAVIFFLVKSHKGVKS